MTEIINPEFLNQPFKALPRSWRRKIGYWLIIAFLLIALSLAGYLIYQDYYRPDYQLKDFLPAEYSLAAEYKKDENSLSNIALAEILAQPAFSTIYQTAESQMNSYLQDWPLDLRMALKKTPEALWFLTADHDFGLLFKLDGEKQAEAIKDITEVGQLYLKVIKQNIAVISNNAQTTEKITSQKIRAKSPFDLSVSLNPWLKIYLHKNFFSQTFDHAILADLQTILQPLSQGARESYTMHLVSRPHQLLIQLQPEIAADQKERLALDNYLKYLPATAVTVLGVNDLKDLEEQLTNNVSLNDYFKQADFLAWLTSRLSLSQQLKNMQSPVIMTDDGHGWQLITNTANQQALDEQLKGYLGQFNPLTQDMVLPDGTKATELVANPAAIQWQSMEQDGWQIFSYQHPQQNSFLGYAVKDEVMIVGNKIENFGNFSTNQDCLLPNVSTILQISPPKMESLTLNHNLTNFAKISAISSSDSRIQLCFDLK